jgi:hypothetical protein
VTAALSLPGIGFLGLHFMLMRFVMMNPQVLKNAKNAPFQPVDFIVVFKWFYLFFGAALMAAALLNVLSAIFLQTRRHRIFSMVVASLNCLQIPFGTALGIYTIIVLSRPSVEQSYGDPTVGGCSLRSANH